MGEQGDAGDIAERPQALTGAAVIVHGNGSALAGLDAGAVQAETGGVRPARP